LLVDVEVKVSQFEDGENAVKAKMDVNEIISKVRDFVKGINKTSVGGHGMAVSVDNFNFSVGKSEGKYNLKFNASFSFSLKEPV